MIFSTISSSWVHRRKLSGATQPPRITRVSGKLPEISSDPHQNHRLPGFSGELRHDIPEPTARQGHPDPGRGTENYEIRAYLSTPACKGHRKTVGSDLSSTASTTALQKPTVTQALGPSARRIRPPAVEVRQPTQVEHERCETSTPWHADRDRCVSERMGSVLQRCPHRDTTESTLHINA